MSNKKLFHVGDLLSVSTHLLLSPTGMRGIYLILNHLTGDELMTHQLPAATEAVDEALLDEHPWLTDLTPPGGDDRNSIMNWLGEIADEHGEFHEVTAVPHLWQRRDPIADLVELRQGRS